MKAPQLWVPADVDRLEDGTIESLSVDPDVWAELGAEPPCALLVRVKKTRPPVPATLDADESIHVHGAIPRKRRRVWLGLAATAQPKGTP